MVPLLAQVISLADEGIIHLFVFRAEKLDEVLPIVKNGYSIRFGSRHIEALSRHPAVDYSCWREQLVAGSWLGMSSTVAPLVTIEDQNTLPLERCESGCSETDQR